MKYHLNLTGTSKNPIGFIAELDTIIDVGFGEIIFSKNGEVIDLENYKPEKTTLQEYETVAAEEPNAVWQLKVIDALSDVTYLRDGTDKWIIIEAGQGIA